jgi:hypothetical protein
MEQTTIPGLNSVYPAPNESNEISNITPTQKNAITQLAIPTPNCGKAVITGQLLVEGEGGQPFITTLYLASTIQSSKPGDLPKVNFLEQSNPITIQEVGTGRFMFAEVAPSKFGLVVWTPVGGYPLKDSNGNTILIDVKPNESIDLGIIPIK